MPFSSWIKYIKFYLAIILNTSLILPPTREKLFAKTERTQVVSTDDDKITDLVKKRLANDYCPYRSTCF